MLRLCDSLGALLRHFFDSVVRLPDRFVRTFLRQLAFGSESRVHFYLASIQLLLRMVCHFHFRDLGALQFCLQRKPLSQRCRCFAQSGCLRLFELGMAQLHLVCIRLTFFQPDVFSLRYQLVQLRCLGNHSL